MGDVPELDEGDINSIHIFFINFSLSKQRFFFFKVKHFQYFLVSLDFDYAFSISHFLANFIFSLFQPFFYICTLTELTPYLLVLCSSGHCAGCILENSVIISKWAF